MVGRFANRYTWRQIKELYDLTAPYLESNCPPRTNIAPTQTSFVVREDGLGERELVPMQWGLVPSWSKEGKMTVPTFNAKAETAPFKPTFRSAFKERPCLVVADGFYEWAQTVGREKQPYFITRADDKPFAFAGIWESWKVRGAPSDEKPLETFSIITTTTNRLCALVHDRMPVMLAPEEWPKWFGTPDDRLKLLRPFPAEDMTMWRVGNAVSNVKNERPDLADPIPDGPEKKWELF